MTRPLIMLFLLLAAVGAVTAEEDPPLPRERHLRSKSLRLTPPQQTALKELEQSSRRESDQLKDLIEDRRDDLTRLYRAFQLDLPRIRQVHQEIAQAQQRLLQIRFRTQSQLRTILSAEQFAALQKVLDDDDDRDRRR